MRSLSFFPLPSFPIDPAKRISSFEELEEDEEFEEESHFMTRQVFRAQPPGTEAKELEWIEMRIERTAILWGGKESISERNDILVLASPILYIFFLIPASLGRNILN